MSLKEMARQVLERNREENTPTPEPPSGEIEPIDADTLIERIGIKYDTPALGKAVLTHPRDGSPLAFEGDPPHVRLFAWSLLNIPPGRAAPIDPAKAAKDCQLRLVEVRDSLARLVKDGDLIRTAERGREVYRLNVLYPEGDMP